MKKIFYSILGIVATLLLVGFIAVIFFPEKLIPLMFDQQFKVIQARAKNSETLLADKENITIFTVGTASPLPGDRVQTGTAIFVNGHFFMFDVGDGVVRRAENMGLPLARLDGIFITHWHSDHMMDLPSLISRSWLLGRTNDLHLYGPDGTDTLNQAIDQFLHIENQHRVAHHGMEMMDISKARAIPHEFKNVQGGKAIIYQQDGIIITAFDVDHEPIEPAVGYVIEYKGKKVVLSGDTKKDNLVLVMSKDADVLIHEVMLMSLLAKMETNLKKQGMLALTFADPASYDLVRQDDKVSIPDFSEFAPGQPLTVVLDHADGTQDSFKVNHSYNAAQIDWVRAGSALNKIREDLAKA